MAEEVDIPVRLFHFKIRARNNWGTIDRHIDQMTVVADPDRATSSNGKRSCCLVLPYVNYIYDLASPVACENPRGMVGETCHLAVRREAGREDLACPDGAGCGVPELRPALHEACSG